jgi:hypothetical protein
MANFPFLLEKMHFMPAPQKELHRIRRIQLLDRVRSVVALAQADAVRVLLPALPDVVAMTEQALVAMNVGPPFWRRACLRQALERLGVLSKRKESPLKAGLPARCRPHLVNPAKSPELIRSKAASKTFEREFRLR